MTTHTSSSGAAVARAARALRRAVAGADYPVVRARAPRPSPGERLRLPGKLLLLLGLCTVTAEYLLSDRHLPAAASWPLAVLTVAPAALLPRRPLAAWRLTILGLLFGTFNAADPTFPWNPVQILLTLAVLLFVAVRADRAVLAWVGLITLLPVWIFVAPSNQVAVALVVVALLLVGTAFHQVRQVSGELAAQTEVSEREQGRRAVLEERARIARELHDVVAHHMSMLAVRAETAPYRLAATADAPVLPEPVRAEFTELAQAARDALTDMRRLLGVLRSEGADPELAPQPDLTGVSELVEGARRAGLEVSYLPPPAGTERRPPAAVALAGFRIVQEALANATRHAPGAPVTVQVWPGSHELSVRVHNGPPPALRPAPSSPVGGGHGVAGMRDRAAVLGGDFTAEPTPDGGYSVAASLPYGGDTAGGTGGGRGRPAPAEDAA